MDKKKIVGVIVAIVIMAVVIVGVAVTVGKKSEVDNESKKGNVTNTESITTAEYITFSGDEEMESNEGESETNYWDNVEVYEETGSSEEKTDKNGEIITESYPGEDDGWSPIVSPDDLAE